MAHRAKKPHHTDSPFVLPDDPLARQELKDYLSGLGVLFQPEEAPVNTKDTKAAEAALRKFLVTSQHPSNNAAEETRTQQEQDKFLGLLGKRVEELSSNGVLDREEIKAAVKLIGGGRSEALDPAHPDIPAFLERARIQLNKLSGPGGRP